MKHPIDPCLEYFAFLAPDGVCVVVMCRGAWVEKSEGLPLSMSCAKLIRVCDSLRGEVRRMVDKKTIGKWIY